MLRPAAAAALAVIAAVGAAGTAAAQDGAQDAARWGPVAEQLGPGSGICRDTTDGGETIICAVVLCEDGALTLGVLGAVRDGGAGHRQSGGGEAGSQGDGEAGSQGGGGETDRQSGGGEGDAPSAFRGVIAVDGESVERDMQGRVVMTDFLHVRTPIDPGEPLWQRLRAGNQVSLTSSPEGEPLDYSLRGSAAELARVAGECR